jgi:SAM-dependent methyltransferase
LCGAGEARVLIDRAGGSFTSDSRIVAGGLRKLECARCGLVRNGHPFDSRDLADHYGSYELGMAASIAEPLFFTGAGPVRRSEAIAGWIAEAVDEVLGRPPCSVMEIGCGEGHVLDRLRTRWPQAGIAGVDLSDASAALARSRGLAVTSGGYRDVDGSHELIYSFAVIEHVPSPMDYFGFLKGRLTAGGQLVVAQPCQDRGSNDVFFSDHLHHFCSRHVGELGRRAGLVERLRRVGHPLIPDFSLHVFAEEGTVVTPAPDAATVATVRQTIDRWQSIFDRLDRWLESAAGRPIVIWGLGQMFQMFCAYTRLSVELVAAGIDDNPSRFAGRLPFPVTPLEAAALPPGAKVLVTFAPNRRAVDRLAAAGLEHFAPLGDAAS